MSKAPLFAVLFLIVAAMLAGCMPGGAAMNPGWTVVAAADGQVYAALATGQVVGLDATNGGAQLWVYPPAQQQTGGGGGLTSLFGRRNTENTVRPLDAVYGLPVLTDTLVLVTSYDHHLYGFDRNTGEKVWEPFAAQEPIIGGVAVYDGVAYFGSSDYHVYAVNIETGEPVWAEAFATSGWVWGAPAVDAERVYFGSMDHSVYALDRATGQLVWQKSVGGSVPGSVALADGVLFVGGVDKQLHALNKADGSEAWAKDLGHWVWGEALVIDGYVYASSLDGKVYALSVADGSSRWAAPAALGSVVRAGPARLGDDLLVGTESGALYRVNAASGEATEFFRAEGAILSTPAVVDNMVYVGTATGNIYALDTSRQNDPQVWRYPPPKQ